MNSTPPSLSALSILCWNADGLARRVIELKNYVIKNATDIILIQEVKNLGRFNVNIPNYSFYHKPRPSAPNHGGVAIYVRNSLPHRLVTDVVMDCLEAVSIVVHFNAGESWLITSAYVRHGFPFPEADFVKLFDYHPCSITAGDLNSPHTSFNCATNSRNGRQLLKLIADRNLEAKIPSEPTFFRPTGRPSTLDLALINNVNCRSVLEVLDIFDSDHQPILLNLDLHVKKDAPARRLKTDWRSYTEILATSPLNYPVISDPGDIEDAIKTLNETILKAREDASREAGENTPYFKFPLIIRNNIKIRNRLRRLFQSTHSPTDRQNYYRAKAQVRRQILNFKQESWSRYMDEINSDHTTIWRLVKAMKNPHFDYPPIHGENGVAFTDEAKAENFALTYEKQFQLHNDLIDPDFDEQVDDVVENFLAGSPSHHFPPVRPTEVVTVIKNLSNKKSAGNDGINNTMIKNIPVNIVIYITKIINDIFKYKYFPKIWKTAIVCAIPKKGDQSITSNYRPISLLSCLSKVAEKFIHSRLYDFIRAKDILPAEQFGFRPNHSTQAQALRVVEFAKSALADGEPSGALFLDLSCAFDKVPHPHLIYKLIQLGAEDSLIHLLHSYLSDRYFSVRVRRAFSTLTPIESGVLQGSILGPTLFNIYTSDIPRTDYTSLAIYADDTAVLARSCWLDNVAGQIQAHVDILEGYFLKWKIKINPSKCQAIYFGHNTKNLPKRIVVEGRALDWDKTGKYLGITLDKRLVWGAHVETVCKRMALGASVLGNLFSSNKLNLRNKIKLYKMIILPIAAYGSSVWAAASNSNLKKIETSQMKILRKIRKAPRFLTNIVVRRDLRVSSIKTTFSERAIKFYDRLRQLPNDIIASLPDYDFRELKNARRPRAVMLLSDE